jgi:hypothetical protein
LRNRGKPQRGDPSGSVITNRARLRYFPFTSLGFLSIWAIFAGIKAKDGARFDRAFEKFTPACNSCRKAVGLGFIDMREPLRSPIMTSPFSNQSFEPK